LAPEGRRIRFAAVRTAALAAGALLVVLPVTIRNYVVGKDFVLVTWSLGTNLYNSNNERSWTEGRMASKELRPHPILIEHDSVRIAEEEEGRPLKPSEVSSFWVRRTLDGAGEDPGKAVGFLGRKLLYFLQSFELPSSYHYEAQREQTKFLRHIPGSFGTVCTLALVGLLVVALRRRRAAPLIYLFLAYAVGLAIFYPLGHYRAPVLPAVIPLAAVGLLHILETATLGRPRTFLMVVLALVVALGVTHSVPLAEKLGIGGVGGYPDDRAVFYYNQGLFMIGQGKDLEAERSFRMARERDPTSFLPDLGMAFLARSRGERATEQIYLEKVLRRRPRDALALVHLGGNLFDRGQREAGLRMAEEAARIAPKDWPVRSMLATMYFELERYEDALVEFEAITKWSLPSAEAYLGQAISLKMLGRHEEALRRIERGLRLPGSDERLEAERKRILEAMAKEEE
ncbi:MAG: tetratricopeptide repeat protein, partial [Planctomycetota bacterium]